MEKYETGTGQVISVHNKKDCNGQPCPIHNPSDHCMRDFPTHWRDDRGIMERICPHGVGHPDPDDLRIRNGEDSGVHGCDGCCSGDYPIKSEPGKNIHENKSINIDQYNAFYHVYFKGNRILRFGQAFCNMFDIHDSNLFYQENLAPAVITILEKYVYY